jgi:hypothetical protein
MHFKYFFGLARVVTALPAQTLEPPLKIPAASTRPALQLLRGTGNHEKQRHEIFSDGDSRPGPGINCSSFEHEQNPSKF